MRSTRPRPGDLRQLVTIQSVSYSQTVIGEDLDVFADWLTNVPARITDLSGTEFFKSELLQAEVTHVVTIRYVYPDSGHLNGVEAKMRVLFGTRIFDIRSVINPEEQRPTWLDLHCRELIQT